MAQKKRRPSMGTFIGYYTDTPASGPQLEVEIGRPFEAARLNAAMHKTGGAAMGFLNAEYDRHLALTGRRLRCYRNANVDPSQGWTFGNIQTHRADVERCFQEIRDNPRFDHDNPLAFSFHHEQAVTPDDPTDLHQEAGGAPEDYALAFNYVFSVAEDMGMLARDGGEIQPCFVPQARQYLASSDVPADVVPWLVENIYPGGYYVQMTGVDIYQKLRADGSYNRDSLVPELDACHQFALSQEVRYLVGEIGVVESADKPRVMTDAFEAVKRHGVSGPGSCHMLCWTVKGDGSPDTSPEALDVFKRYTNQSFYRRGIPS